MKEILDIQSAAPSRIQRADTFVDFDTKRVQLFDMRKQLATNLFLIGIREARYLRDSLFKRFDHERSLAHFARQGSRIWSKKVADDAPAR